jgi:peptide chain release factor 1
MIRALASSRSSLVRIPCVTGPRSRILVAVSGFPRPHAYARTILSNAVTQRVDTMVQRHAQIVQQLNNPDHDSSKLFSTLGKELSALAPVVSLHDKMTALQQELQGVRDLLKEASESQDPEMERECQDDVQRLLLQHEDVEKRILLAVLPRDENDTDSDAILEIRAGTGGDEASLFAGELLETFSQTAKAMKWRVDLMSINKTDLGGVKEATISVIGQATSLKHFLNTGQDDDHDDADADDNAQEMIGPYGFFRFESGVHRVQRVPINDTRIQTSACSVGVMPALPEDDTDALLPMSELRIETMRASGAGGQHVNTTDSAVRVTHIPTGMTASIQDERSQHKNKAKALKLITARVRQHLRQEEDKARGAERSSLMGGGDRSERVRTYNFPQDRVTDHRCKHSTYGLEKLLQGSIEGGLVATFFPLLRQEYKEELMKQFESSPS